jgi:nitrite reductase/ring-hydroxylating ferredoxin subunit
VVDQLEPIEHAVNKGGERVLSFVGRQEWLDRPSYRFEHVLGFVFNAFGGARNRVTNALNGVWLGHPVHAPLVSVASGAIGTTLTLDALTVLAGKKGKAALGTTQLADHALALGILANLGSVVTGMTDWQHTHEQERRIGLVHGLLNVTATTLYVFSWNERRRGRHLRGRVASVIGYGISAGSGYLGGALVFGSGIGIDRSGARLNTSKWIPVLSEKSLANGKPQRVDVDGVGVVVCHDGDSVAAVGEFCPHLAAPMADGWLDRGRIVCPWHGSQFDVESGRVIKGPATAPLPRYQARVNGGVVEVRCGANDSSDRRRLRSFDCHRSGNETERKAAQ